MMPYLRVVLLCAKDLYDQKITNEEVMAGKVDFKRQGDPTKYQLSHEMDLRVLNFLEHLILKKFVPLKLRESQLWDGEFR